MKTLLAPPQITRLGFVWIPEASREERLRKAKYGSVNPILKERHPFSLSFSRVRRKLALGYFPEYSTDEIANWTSASDFVLAMPDDMFAFGTGSTYKDLQQEFEVHCIGLAPVVGDCKSVIYSNYFKGSCHLGICVWERASINKRVLLASK